MPHKMMMYWGCHQMAGRRWSQNSAISNQHHKWDRKVAPEFLWSYNDYSKL